ncbi:MAG TPA: Asp-tRNA(Asn)/Glu-tRNA(Gln) amidotransferase subunit GatA [Oceanithermus profundus]|uniref:Glutamyl-tRNA(Gln) amidotransferase subunit A n=1 Tax=Oceanithermus profundus TaxID=187137 RepID=A0A7C4Z439_9DEIN|nr:Asp-tRNA(Asn)/Glu-tRNA(Gln) amidotransferase subunit GatA [Oceanithermus profundus]
MDAVQIAQQVTSGELDPLEPVRAALERIERFDGDVRAFLRLNPRAEEEALRVKQRLAAGEALPLAGVPVAVKDNLTTRGLATTCASGVLADFVPPYDAAVVERLRAAGAVVVGKTNLDEFAMGSSTEHSHFGPTKNPWDLERVPGGSSGGSAAAVAAGYVPVALGSDTGGSVRQPAAFTGTLGFKPTYGRISRYGLVAFASSLDQVGSFARTTADLACVSRVLMGHDPRDATSLEAPLPRLEPDLGRARGYTLGLVRETLQEGNSPGVVGALERFRRLLEAEGVRFVEVSLPSLRHALAAYYLVATAEASSNLARYDGVHYGTRAGADDVHALMRRTREQGFGPEVKRRILMGTFALSSGYYDAYYGRALKVRRRIAGEFASAFAEVDLLVTPTTPTPAFRLGAKLDDPMEMYLSDVDTVAVNLAGLPALSLPAGFEEGLPIGVQLIAPALAEDRLFDLSELFERLTEGAYLQRAPLD